jgi:hypothetical protein
LRLAAVLVSAGLRFGIARTAARAPFLDAVVRAAGLRAWLPDFRLC